jgi:hypothetical protein
MTQNQPTQLYYCPGLGDRNQARKVAVMAYPGDFVAANRAARDAAINFFRMAKEPKRRLDLRRIYFRLWKGWKRALLRV